jgi:uncharacterized membrane protein YbhN (UPF0104 family)
MPADQPAASEQPRVRRPLAGWATIIVRLTATVGLMTWAVWNVDWPMFMSKLAAAEAGWWLAGLTVTLLVQVIAGLRWASLARPLGFDFPRRFFVRRFYEGMFFSLCLPSSIGGDVVKAARIGSSTPLRLLAACSVLADRLTGLSALGVLVGTAVLSRRYGLGTAGTLGIFAGLLGLALLDRVHAALPEDSAARRFVAQLLPYRERPQFILLAVLWSFVVQAGGVLAVTLVARSLDVSLPALVWLSVVPLVALAMVLPISIGGLGVREKSFEALLPAFGVPAETALAIALLWGLCTTLAGLLGGVVFLLERRPLETPSTTAAVG